MTIQEQMSNFLADAQKTLGAIENQMKIMAENQQSFRDTADAYRALQDERLAQMEARNNKFKSTFIALFSALFLSLVGVGFKADTWMDGKITKLSNSVEKKGYATEQEVYQGFGIILDTQSDIAREAGVDDNYVEKKQVKAIDNINIVFGHNFRTYKKN